MSSPECGKAEKRAKKHSAVELENLEEREILALETAKVETPQDNHEQNRETKSREVLDVFDGIILKALSVSGRACRISFSIYVLMMGFGIALLVYSLIHGAIEGLDVYSAFFASLGMVSLVSILLIAPKSKISKSAANLVQSQILYRSYVNQLAVIWTRGLHKPQERSMDEIERTSRLLEQVTFSTVDKIESLTDKKISDNMQMGLNSAQGQN